MMASKKPAKPIAGQSREKQPELPGKAVKYIVPANSGVSFECPTCKRSLSRGIIYEYEGNLYCKRGCIKVKAA